MPAEAIISIRPNFAEAILSGTKSVELRRRVPSLEIGTRLWIYATKPVGEVLGSAFLQEILRGSPDTIWRQSVGRNGVDRLAFDSYFHGTTEAVGLVLGGIQRGRPISIEALRGLRRGFHPPQVVARVTMEEAEVLQQLSR